MGTNADLLLVIIIGVVLLSVLLAKTFMPKPGNNGLRFEHELHRKHRHQ